MIVGVNEALIFPRAVEWDFAQAALSEAGFGDGLPLVVPTQERLDDMLSGVADIGRSRGDMPPLLGALSMEAIAYCCVLAGCKPAELLVVSAAAEATLEPEFNLLGIQTTTGTPTVCVLVHGPLVRDLAMNAGANCLGSGNRANACVGRAVQLVLRNVGGAIPGLTDMATVGQPGKYVFCFAEGDSPLIPSLAVRRGLDAGVSAVTVIGVSGTMEVLPHHPADNPACVLLPVVDAMHGARLAHDARETRPGAEQFVLLPPEMGELVQTNGWDLRRVQDFIWERSPPGIMGQNWPLASTPEDITVISAGGTGTKMTCLVPWGAASRSITHAI